MYNFRSLSSSASSVASSASSSCSRETSLSSSLPVFRPVHTEIIRRNLVKVFLMTSSFKSLGYLSNKDELEKEITEKIKRKERIEEPELMFNMD